MLRNTIKPWYIALITQYDRLRNFFLPNLLTRTPYSFHNMPVFAQRTLVRGEGRIEIGKDCIFGARRGGFHYGGSIELQTRVESARITIGNNVSTNNNIFICAACQITIGDYTCIGQNVTIMDFEAHGTAADKRNEMGDAGSITIHENVWIGNNVIILKNSEIRANSIVAAGAVVAGVFPANAIIGGVPAKVIKTL